MAELNSRILSNIILLESRILEWISKRREAFWEMIKDLYCTKYSWRIVKLMLQISPWNTALVILGRCVEGVLPSVQLRLKTKFLDIVQAALEKKPFDKRLLYRLAVIQVCMYYFSSTVSDILLTADNRLGHALSHHLQIDLLRAHLRLSPADLSNGDLSYRHRHARDFTTGSIESLLGPLRLVQDSISTVTQTYTLRSVLWERGAKASGIIWLSWFNCIFRAIYDHLDSDDDRDYDEWKAKQRRDEFFNLATSTSSRAEVSTFGLKEWILETYSRIAGALQSRDDSQKLQIRLRGTTRGFVRNVTESLCYILAATKYREVINLSSLSLLQSTSRDIVWDLESLYRSFDRMRKDLIYMKEYFDFLDPTKTPSATPRMEPFANYHEPTGRGMKITAKDISFAYPEGQEVKQVLKNLTFTIEPGELIAVVGGNGSGKSTLVKLLARLYDVTSGSLEINDIDIRRYDNDELWSHMSSVNQDFRRYTNFTIGENIGIGDISNLTNPTAISHAAQTSGAHEFIETFPKNYNTLMSQHYYHARKSSNQVNLSGGQWQRLALSRGFMRLDSADLLLLDEPSASLDPEAEFKLFKGLKEARRGRTTVYISHRFNTVRAATRIMVIEKGELVEFGTHDELMALDGRYKYLYGLQTDALADDVSVVKSETASLKGDETPKSIETVSTPPIPEEGSSDSLGEVDEVEWTEDHPEYTYE